MIIMTNHENPRSVFFPPKAGIKNRIRKEYVSEPARTLKCKTYHYLLLNSDENTFLLNCGFFPKFKSNPTPWSDAFK